VYSWFKSWNQDSHHNGKISIHSNSNYRNRNHNTHIGIFLSRFLWNPKGFHKFSDRIFTCNRSSHRTRLFFINRHFANSQKKQEKLENHFKLLNENVLKHWFDKSIKPCRQKNGFHESLIPLYISVIDDLKSPRHFGEMRSHLLHPDNKELNNILKDFEKRESAHNKKVSEFMSTIEGKIRDSITNKDDMLSRSCNIDHIVFYDSGPETRMPNCILRHAVFYYREKAQKDLDLDIRKLEENNNIFQLHTNPDMIEIGRGDKESMICLKNKLKSLEFLAQELKVMINERDALVKLFNDDFKNKTKTTMADLDNNYFSGECIVEERLRKR
jgi:hypothetical protein